MRMTVSIAGMAMCGLLVASVGAAQGNPMELLKLPVAAADKVQYGKGALQFGELRLPQAKGPVAVVMIVHGGCWADHLPGQGAGITSYELLRPLAAALTEGGVATWNVEYRRAGSPGGEWPAAYTDLGAAMDYLRVLAPLHGLDLARVTVLGHSSGGQLALWLGARAKLPVGSELYTKGPLGAKLLVDVDGPADLEHSQPLESMFCPMPAVTQFVGGTPAEKPVRYREGAGEAYLPLGVPQVIFEGGLLHAAAPVIGAYEKEAMAKGDAVTVVSLGESGHFDMLDPKGKYGQMLVTGVLDAVKGKGAGGKPVE